MKKEQEEIEDVKVEHDTLNTETKEGEDKAKEKEDVIPLTKFQKFKNFFKQSEVSISLLKSQLVFLTFYMILGLLFGFGSSAGAVMVSFMLVDIFLPLQKEYIKTTAWKIYFVYVPVWIFGFAINYYIHGVGAFNTIFVLAFIIRIFYSVVMFALFIFSKDKKARLHNLTLNFISIAVFYVAVTVSATIFS